MMKSEIPSPRRQPCIDATSRTPIQTAHPANSTEPYIKVPLELKLQVKLPRCVGERCYGLLIKVLREGWPKMVPDMPRESAQFEPVAWWWARKQIGQDLRERYEVPKELPPKLLTLVRKLDDSDWLQPNVS